MDRGRGRGRVSKGRASQTSPQPGQSHINSSPTASSTLTPSTLQSYPQTQTHSYSARGRVNSPTSFTQSPQQQLPAHPSTMGPIARGVSQQSDGPAVTASPPFESPPKARNATPVGVSTRRRSRGVASNGAGDEGEDHEGQAKGGHSLRKRARIDYTQLHEAVEIEGPAHAQTVAVSKKTGTPAAPLTRKRRNTQDLLSGSDSDYANGRAKRARSEKAASGLKPVTPSSRRQGMHRRQPHRDQSPSNKSLHDNRTVGASMDAEIEGSHSSHQSSSGNEPKSALPSEFPPSRLVASGDQNDQSPLEESLPTEKDPASTSETDRYPSRGLTAAELKEMSELQAELNRLSRQVRAAYSHSERAHAQQEVKEQSPSSSQYSSNATAPTKREDRRSPDDRIDSIEPSDSPDDRHGAPSSTTPTSHPHIEGLPVEKAGPKVLPQLKPVYAAAPETCRQLKAYEVEEVILPASWTEVSQPQEKAVPIATPTATPVHTPPPGKPTPYLDSWKRTKLPTYKVFFEMYREDKYLRQVNGKPPITLMEYRTIVSRKHFEALEKRKQRLADPPPVEADPEPVAPPPMTKKGRGRKTKRGLKAKGQVSKADSPIVETPRVSPAVESQVPTAAPTPEPQEEEAHQDEPGVGVAGEDDDMVGDHEVDPEGNPAEAENDGPLVPEIITKIPKRQYAFKKLPDPTGFEDQLADPQDLDTEDLYDRLEASAEAIKAWQEEYNELRKICDDEDNAKRRVQNDKAIENWDARQKLDEPPIWRRTFTDVLTKVPPFFELKGARAPKAYVDDPEEQHQREEDLVMAQAYGFAHDNDRRHIGKQNPEAQRWDMSENRLRERKQTKKAADAAEEGAVVEGKRTRKPRVVGDQSAQPSRAATPAPITRPRRTKRGAQVEEPAPTGLQADEVNNSADVMVDDVAEPVPEPVVTRKRGPRGKVKAGNVVAAVATPEVPADPMPDPRPADLPLADSTQAKSESPENSSKRKYPDLSRAVFEDEMTDKTQAKKRKRGQHPLATASFPAPPDSLPRYYDDYWKNDNSWDAPCLPAPTKKQRKTKAQTSASTPVDNEVPANSFYRRTQEPDSMPQHDDQPRPSTSSSNGTAHTAGTIETSYSLRSQKPRNYAEENDPGITVGGRKRARAKETHKETPKEAAKEATEETPKKTTMGTKKRTPVPDSPEADNQPSVLDVADEAVMPDVPNESVTFPAPDVDGTPEVQDVQMSERPQPPSGPRKTVRHIKKPRSKEKGKGKADTATGTGARASVDPAVSAMDGQDHMMHTFSAHPEPAPDGKPVKKTRIKLVTKPLKDKDNTNRTSAGPSESIGSTPIPEDGDTPMDGSDLGDPEKPYAEMSKSEKMSYSMKRRFYPPRIRNLPLASYLTLTLPHRPLGQRTNGRRSREAQEHARQEGRSQSHRTPTGPDSQTPHA